MAQMGSQSATFRELENWSSLLTLKQSHNLHFSGHNSNVLHFVRVERHAAFIIQTSL